MALKKMMNHPLLGQTVQQRNAIRGKAEMKMALGPKTLGTHLKMLGMLETRSKIIQAELIWST